MSIRSEVHDDFIRIIDETRTVDFHLRWLRHNCDVDRHPTTRERIVDSAELPDVLAVDEALVEDAVLRVRWAFDRRTSRYPIAWLLEHAYAVNRVSPPRPPSKPETLELHGDPGAARILQHLEQHGAALVRRESRHPEDETDAWIAAFEAQGLRVITTHFGRIEDLRTDNTTNTNTDQLGYTDAAIDLHTDQPFLDDVPRYQLLHGIRSADEGGETVLADARAAFSYLESIDRDAASRLVATPVRFHRKQKRFERVVVSPIITRTDDRFQIRSSYFTAAPFHLPFNEMQSWYRAHDRFVRLVRDPRNHYRFRLRPGDALIYDNHRMLHGRTAFRGERWVRGVYFDPPAERTSERASDDADFDRSG